MRVDACASRNQKPNEKTQNAFLTVNDSRRKSSIEEIEEISFLSSSRNEAIVIGRVDSDAVWQNVACGTRGALETKLSADELGTDGKGKRGMARSARQKRRAAGRVDREQTVVRGLLAGSGSAREIK